TGLAGPPHFAEVELRRPVVVPARGTTTLRVAALVRAPGRVELAVRTSATAFATDHFRAVCVFPAVPAPAAIATAPADPRTPTLPLDPERDLYAAGILFHTGRFRRVGGYRRLRATECVADLLPAPPAARSGGWFNRYLPATLLLGDPGARD